MTLRKMIIVLVVTSSLLLCSCAGESTVNDSSASSDLSEASAVESSTASDSSELFSADDSSFDDGFSSEDSSVSESYGEISVDSENTAVIYTPNDDYTRWEKKIVATTNTPEDIVKNIFDPSSDLNFNGYTAKDIKINSFEIEDGYGYIDMNEAYLSWLNFGTTAEWYGIACLVNSFLETYGLEKIWLTINGGMLSTAHAGDFDYPIGYWGQYI